MRLESGRELFRHEALKTNRHKALGNVVISTSVSTKIVSALLCLSVFTSIGFALSLEYTRKTIARGIVVSSLGVVNIYPPVDGTYGVVNVGLADDVWPGQFLFKILPDVTSSQGGKLSEQESQALKKEITILESKLSRSEKIYEIRLEEMTRKIHSIESRKLLTINQIASQQKVVDSEKGLLERISRLYEGDASSTLELVQIEGKYIESTQALQRLLNEKIILSDLLAEVRLKIDAAPLEKAEERAEIELNISTAKRQLFASMRAQGAEVFNSIDGKVTSIRAQVGARALQTSPALTVVPSNGRLQAEIYVPVGRAGFLQEGQSVRIRYDSFPSEKYGYYVGRVISVSNSPNSVSDLIGINFKEGTSVYVAIVELPTEQISKSGRKIDLQVGMSLQAIVLLDKVSVWEMLLGAVINKKAIESQ